MLKESKINFYKVNKEKRFKPDDELWIKGKREFGSILFRSVNASSFENIIINGIDKIPTTEVFDAAKSFDKSYEYGDFPKITLMLNRNMLEKSWDEIEIQKSSEEEIRQLKSKFKSYKVSQDETKIWFSMQDYDKLPEGKMNYERLYGFYIPKNALDAIHKVYIFYTEEGELDSIKKVINKFYQ